MKIVIDNKIRFLGDKLSKYAETVFLPGREITHQSIIDADALLVRTRTRCDAQLLDNTKVKFIATATIGFDHIDTEYCKKNNIFFTNAPGCNSGSVAQYIASALVSLQNAFHLDLTKQTLGIIGCGHVGSKVIKTALNLGMNVIVYDLPLQDNNFNDFELCNLKYLQKNADIITFHVPLISDGRYKTLNMCNSEFIKNLKHNAVIINTSRGQVVNNSDLLQALNNGDILTSVLDVWENEPDINLDLLDKVFAATPHIAGYSVDGKAEATRMTVESLDKFFKLGIEDFKADLSPFNVPVLDYNNIKDVLKTYNILSDSDLLKANPDKFEFFREHYPARRENL